MTPAPHWRSLEDILVCPGCKAGLTVQPFTIDYTHIGREPITPGTGSLVYWDDPETPLPGQ